MPVLIVIGICTAIGTIVLIDVIRMVRREWGNGPARVYIMYSIFMYICFLGIELCIGWNELMKLFGK